MDTAAIYPLVTNDVLVCAVVIVVWLMCCLR